MVDISQLLRGMAMPTLAPRPVVPSPHLADLLTRCAAARAHARRLKEQSERGRWQARAAYSGGGQAPMVELKWISWAAAAAPIEYSCLERWAMGSMVRLP